MAVNDPYRIIKKSLPLLDHMHRFLLPRMYWDMAAIMMQNGINRVLDMACGTGYTVCALRRKGFEVIGVDLSREMLSVASQKAGDCGFVLGNGIHQPFKADAFDGALISLALHEMFPAIREKVWSETKRVVRPGGRIFILDFARLPGKRTLYSRIVAQTILKIERSTLKFDPDHWHNSMQFQEEGGLVEWLHKVGADVNEMRAYLGGNVVLTVVKNP